MQTLAFSPSLSPTPLSRPSRVSFLGYILLQQDQFSFFASEASEPKRPKSFETRIRSSMQTLKLLTSWNLNPKNIFLAGQQKQKKTSTKTGLKSGFPNRPPTKVSVSKKNIFLKVSENKKKSFSLSQGNSLIVHQAILGILFLENREYRILKLIVIPQTFSRAVEMLKINFIFFRRNVSRLSHFYSNVKNAWTAF